MRNRNVVKQGWIIQRNLTFCTPPWMPVLCQNSVKFIIFLHLKRLFNSIKDKRLILSIEITQFFPFCVNQTQ